MKNYSRLFSIGVLYILTLFSCDSQNSDSSRQDSSSLIIPGGRFYSYRLIDNIKDDEEETWKANRYVGMYLLEERSIETINGCENVKYESISDSKHFVATVPEEAFTTPADKSGVHLLGYAPYNETITDGIYPLDVAMQDGNPQLQFYYASKSDVLYKEHSKTYLEFRPVLTKAVFKLTPNVGVEENELNNAVIRINGMYTKGGFNLLTGNFTEASETGPISLACGEGHSANALVLPAESVENYSLTVTLPGLENSTREWNFAEALSKLESGMQYTFSISITPNSMKIDVEQTPITDWETGVDTPVNKWEENLLAVNLENLPEGALLKVQNYNEIPEDTWFYRYYKGEEETSFAKITMEDGKKVVHFKLAQDNDVTASDKIVGCQLQNASKGIFSITFMAKADVDVNMHAYLRTGTQRYIASEGGKGDASVKILADKFQSYTINFDFSKTVKNTWDGSGAIASTDDDLKNVYVGFNFNHKPAEVKLYDMKIVLKK